MKNLKKISKIISDFQSNNQALIEVTLDLSRRLRKVSNNLQNTWSGSFAGWHGKMYFRNFEVPALNEKFSGEWGGINGIPDGWEEKQNEEVKLQVETLIGDNFSIDEYKKDIVKIKKNAEDLKNEVIIILSSSDFQRLPDKEIRLVRQIEEYVFGKDQGEYLRERIPTNIMSRDLEAMRQGTFLPDWLYFECVALATESMCESVNQYIVIIDRLVRQLELNSENIKSSPLDASSIRDLHIDIYNKCHKLYESKAYAEAVEKSFKIVRDRLRKLTGYETGSEAFGKGRLHILGASAQNVDEDFNEAVKFLTMAIDRFRNEKSHTSDAKIDDPVRAHEYLRISSLAMNLLDNSEILS